ncbi:MAG: hypothetical protein J1E62_01255 [Lachnospiraceae bacterium]|nr:hypothetical protein [Lachnospiraceae bacterium]
MSYNDFNSLFGLGGNDNSLFGGLSTSLSDYNMIRSGVYGKLLKSYYSTANKMSSDSDDGAKSANKSPIKKAEVREYKYNLKVNQGMQEVKSSSESLSKAAEALNKSSLYENKVAEDGTVKDSRASVKSAVKNFISAYNSYVGSTGSSNSSSIQSQNLEVLKAVSANSKDLAEIGITIDKKGNLVMDEEKFDKADMSKIKALFEGNDSFGKKVGDIAQQTYRTAKSATYSANGGSSYSSSGDYSSLGNANQILDQIL